MNKPRMTYRVGGLSKAQSREMDKDNDGDIDAQDLAMLRKAEEGMKMKMKYAYGGKNKMMYEDGGVPLKKKTIPQEGAEMSGTESAVETRRSKDEQKVDQKQREVIMYMENMGDFAKQYPAQFEQVIAKFAMEMGNEMREENMMADDIPGEFDPAAMQKAKRPRFIE